MLLCREAQRDSESTGYGGELTILHYFRTTAIWQDRAFIFDLVERVKGKYLPIVVSFENYGSVADEQKFLEPFRYNVDFYLRRKLGREVNAGKLEAVSDMSSILRSTV